MSLPFTPNVTCDVYRSGNAPPAAPDVAGLAGHLTLAFPEGYEIAEGVTTERYTHMLRVDLAADVRDSATGFGSSGGTADTVYVPDKNGTQFLVMGVIRSAYGSAQDHRIVYLRRGTTGWPTSYL